MSDFFLKDTATTEIYTLSLHDALPILAQLRRGVVPDEDHRLHRRREVVRGHDPGEHRERLHAPDDPAGLVPQRRRHNTLSEDRKSTRLNSSHGYISYAVFCLKKKKNLR